jgi:tetrahydromethanopterin S-methyltransferase subunit G
MPTVEERLASLEAKVDTMSDLRSLITELRGDMIGRFTLIEGRFTLIEGRFTQVEGRFTELQGEMNRRFEEVNRRLGSLDAKVDRHFVWLMGMMVTGFITVIGALVGVVYR